MKKSWNIYKDFMKIFPFKRLNYSLGALECGCEASAFNKLKKKAAASQPHSKGFAVNNKLLSILHRPVKSLLIKIGIRV
jgi:hypothetical protein